MLFALPGGRTQARVRGDGPGFLWCHGLFNSIDVDDVSAIGPLIDSIEGHRVVRFDARGHGGSAPGGPAGSLWDRISDDAVAIADQLGMQSFVMGGFSMSACGALHAAVKYPDRVKGLVLLGPPTAWEGRVRTRAMFREQAAVLERDGMLRAAADLEQILTKHPDPPGLREALGAVIAHYASRGVDGARDILLGAADSDLPPRDLCRALDLPVLVIGLEGDPGHPIEVARELFELIPGADLFVTDRLDDARLAAVLAAFLDSFDH